jgi:hypothetical protein
MAGLRFILRVLARAISSMVYARGRAAEFGDCPGLPQSFESCGCTAPSSVVVAIARSDVGQDAAESVTPRVAENIGSLVADRARARGRRCIVAFDRHIDLVRDLTINPREIATRERYRVVESHRLAERPEAEAPDASRPRSCRSGPFKSDGSGRAGALALLLAVCGHSAQ